MAEPRQAPSATRPIFKRPITHGAVAVVKRPPPSVIINQAIGQADPAYVSPILFDVTFSEPVTGFTADDVVISGTAGATAVQVTGSGTNYTVAVVMVEPLTVTINQAAGQEDPTSDLSILFDVVFSRPVTGFTAADVVLSGTAGATECVVTGSGAVYTVSVTMVTEVTVESEGLPTFMIGGVPTLFATGFATFDVTVTTTGTFELTEPDVVIVGDTGGYISQFSDFSSPIGVHLSGFRNWGDLDLDFDNPQITAVVTDGPVPVRYPFLEPGYVWPVGNINIVGVVVLSDNRIAITREIDASNTMFMILDTTDKNEPLAIGQVAMSGTMWGSSMMYDASASRVYVGGGGISGTVVNIANELAPVQGDVENNAANATLIGANVIIGSNRLDNRIKVWDTTTLNAWAAVSGEITDATQLSAVSDLIYIGGNRVLACSLDRITLVDVTTPAAPTLSLVFTAASVGASTIDGFTRDGNIVYVTGRMSTANSVHVTALDVSTPSAPTIISSASFPVGISGWSRAHTPRVIDGNLWVWGNVQKLAVVDISDPAAMTLIVGIGLTGVSHTGFWEHDAIAVQTGYAWWVSVFSQLIGMRTGSGF